MSPEEDRTRDAVDSKPKHYQLSYSGPPLVTYERSQSIARGKRIGGTIQIYLILLSALKFCKSAVVDDMVLKTFVPGLDDIDQLLCVAIV